MSKLHYKIEKLNLDVMPAKVNGEPTYYTTGDIVTRVSDGKYLKTEVNIEATNLPKTLTSDLGKAIYNIEKHLNDQVEVVKGDGDLLIDGEGIKINGKTIIKFQ